MHWYRKSAFLKGVLMLGSLLIGSLSLLWLIQDVSALAPATTIVMPNYLLNSAATNNPNLRGGETTGKEQQKCSLWLLPPKSNSETINAQIVKFADNNNGPLFDPHVTVAGGIRCDSDQEMLDAVQTLQEGLKGFGNVECRFNSPFTTPDAWNQALCVEMEESDSFLTLVRSTSKILDRNPEQFTFPKPIGKPHLSLFYGTSNIPPTEEIEPIDAFQSHELALWRTQPSTLDGVAQWKEVARIDLR